MEIFANFNQINWYWTKAKQKQLEKSLTLIDQYLIKNVEEGNNAELLLLTSINSFIEMLNSYELNYLSTKNSLQTFIDTLITDKDIALLITEDTRNKLMSCIQDINNEYSNEQLKIEIYKFILFWVNIFERIVNKNNFENNLKYSKRKSKVTTKQLIINYYMNNKEINQKQIAERLGTSLSYVKKVTSIYRKQKK